MDPNSYAYPYNRIVPPVTNSNDDFQHSHLSISAAAAAAAGSSAQSIILQAAHNSIGGFNTSAGNFVSPNSIGGYNPVFQQIYHHPSAVQPKPAHYAPTINPSNRQICISESAEKSEEIRAHSSSVGYTSHQVTNYYAENSSSGGASPSPTTSATPTTTLSWNSQLIDAPQQMTGNSFVTMQQQPQHTHPHHNQSQQQQSQSNLNGGSEKVTLTKQTNLQSKVQSKTYSDILYVNSGQEHEQNQVNIELDSQIIHAVTEEDCTRPDEGYYSFVDGKLTYNIPASSLAHKLPVPSIKIAAPKKQNPGESHQPTQQHNLTQIPSPAYPIYESPTLCSSVGSPPPAVTSLHHTDTLNNSSQIIVYKSNTPTQQAQTTSDISIVARTTGTNANLTNTNRNNLIKTNSTSSSPSPTAGVAYSSVITSALHAHQQQQQPTPSQHSACWLPEINKHNQKSYSLHSPPVQENIYILPSSLQIKHTFVEPVLQPNEAPQVQSHLQQQMINHSLSNWPLKQLTIGKTTPQHGPSVTSQQVVQAKQQRSGDNVVLASALASQIQSISKMEDVQKSHPPKKSPRKRQPKKALSNDCACPPQQQPQTSSVDVQPSHIIPQAQPQPQQHNVQQQNQLQTPQQQQISLQLQQQNGPFYEYNNRWMIPTKTDHQTNIATYGNNEHNQQAVSISQPQPAHVQQVQSQSQLSQYYSVFPQQVTAQSCVGQNTSNIYTNITQLSHNPPQDQVSLPQTNLQQVQSITQETDNEVPIPAQSVQEVSTYKVIVPNIEDELHFLVDEEDDDISPSTSSAALSQMHTSNLGNSSTTSLLPNSYHSNNSFARKTGFMDSYIKFLQGERDESPAPLIRNKRKYTYQQPINSIVASTDTLSSIKKNSSENLQSIVTPISSESAVNTTAASATEQQSNATSTTTSMTFVLTTVNSENTIAQPKEGNKVRILSQTQILPKKRPQAQNLIAAQENKEVDPVTTQQEQQLTVQAQAQLTQTSSFTEKGVEAEVKSPTNQQIQTQSNAHQDPLAMPPIRHPPLRKERSRSISEAIPSPDEPDDSEADAIWTHSECNHNDGDCESIFKKRKIRRSRGSLAIPIKKKKSINNITNNLENSNKKSLSPNSTTPKPVSDENSDNNSTNITNDDNFKTGDFIVLRSDLVNDWPTIWQVDSKGILEKYETFCENGKTFYRNMSKYAAWNLETKKLYLKAPVRVQVQSHTETIIEFLRSELFADDTEQFIIKIMEDYLSYQDHFEVYIQSIISQILNGNFLSKVDSEKEMYFATSVRIIEEIMENCKKKLLAITPWSHDIIVSLKTWPKCHVFTDWGKNYINEKNCGACHQPGISVRFLLFGQPYDAVTMQTVPEDVNVTYEKDILLCRICAARADIFHKIAHEKYNLFAICTQRVTELQKEFPEKSSTDILMELLAQKDWIDDLFRNLRSSCAEVESLERQKSFHQVKQ